MSLLRLQGCSSEEKQEKLELQVGEQGRLSLLCTAALALHSPGLSSNTSPIQCGFLRPS